MCVDVYMYTCSHVHVFRCTSSTQGRRSHGARGALLSAAEADFACDLWCWHRRSLAFRFDYVGSLGFGGHLTPECEGLAWSKQLCAALRGRHALARWPV